MSTASEIAREIAIRFEDWDMPPHPRAVWRHGLQDAITLAIQQAEARGEERMRERCAVVCDETEVRTPGMTMLQTAAAAIRKLEATNVEPT